MGDSANFHFDDVIVVDVMLVGCRLHRVVDPIIDLNQLFEVIDQLFVNPHSVQLAVQLLQFLYRLLHQMTMLQIRLMTMNPLLMKKTMILMTINVVFVHLLAHNCHQVLFFPHEPECMMRV